MEKPDEHAERIVRLVFRVAMGAAAAFLFWLAADILLLAPTIADAWGAWLVLAAAGGIGYEAAFPSDDLRDP
jgi:hypothetical protein